MLNEQELDLKTRFPLSWHSHEAGWHNLFDLAILGKSLNCAPGDLILDFACGPGYVSEILNRFGYYTVAFDLNPEAIDIAQRRFPLDQRLCAKRASFVVGDALKMPFAEATFDGVICMNAFHHMPDYRQALQEIVRVLKPGCCLVMSEPGSTHARTMLSKIMVEQCGDFEKNIFIDELFQLAGDVGFQEMYLKPFVYPELLTINKKQWKQIKAGNAKSTSLDPLYLSRVIEKTHPIFVFVKAGEQPKTSKNPGILKTLLTMKEFKFQSEPVMRADFKAKAVNLGDCIWLSEAREFGGYVTLGVKILNAEGRRQGEALNRIRLPRDISPGEKIELSGTMQLGNLFPGKYILRFDLVDEFICWFEERSTGYADVEIEV